MTTSADDYRGAEEDILSEAGIDDFHDILNSENHEVCDSDSYVGSNSEYLEFMNEDEMNSILSLTEIIHTIQLICWDMTIQNLIKFGKTRQ